MKLVAELAEKIIFEVQSVMSENIIVVNHEGNIIASTEKKRVGSFHEGAWKVVKTKKKLYITDQLATTLEGVKPGINLPIIYSNDVIGVIGITGIPNEVEPFAEIIRKMTELIIKEANYIEKKEWETRGLESFFYEWIYLNEVDEFFLRKGQILGVAIDKPYQCIMFQLSTSKEEMDHQEIELATRNWFTNYYPRKKHDYLIRWGNGRFVLIVEAAEWSMQKNLSYELSRWKDHFNKHFNLHMGIGIGKTIESSTISKSYEEAKKALKVAEKNNSIIFYDSLYLEIILEEIDEETKVEFLSKVISPIINNLELIETLRIYFTNDLSLKKTADQLHIHINTLHYRLKHISQLTGIDPKSSEGITLFNVAIALMSKD